MLMEKENTRTTAAALTERPRRLRATPALRAMLRETELNARDFIYPMFVRHGQGKNEISSMPGVFQLSVDEAVREAESALKLGVPAVILFGLLAGAVFAPPLAALLCGAAFATLAWGAARLYVRAYDRGKFDLVQLVRQ